MFHKQKGKLILELSINIQISIKSNLQKSMNYQSVNQWKSTQSAPLWEWSWLEKYAKARMFDEMMAFGKSLEEGRV